MYKCTIQLKWTFLFDWVQIILSGWCFMKQWNQSNFFKEPTTDKAASPVRDSPKPVSSSTCTDFLKQQLVQMSRSW